MLQSDDRGPVPPAAREWDWSPRWPEVGRRLLDRDHTVWGLKDLLPPDIRWRATRVHMQPMDHYWSESRPGKWPCVEAWMFRYRVEQWRRPEIEFYTVAVHVQLRRVQTGADYPFSLDTEEAFRTWAEARNHWAVATRDLRPQLR